MIKQIALAAATALAAFTAQAKEFRSADVHNSDDYPTVAAVKHMSQVLEQKSGGKHKIKVFNKSALGSEKETLDQVKIGALEMNRVNISSLNSMCPKSLVPTLPFLFNSVEHMRKVLDGPVGEEILKGCEHEGLVGLAGAFLLLRAFSSGAAALTGVEAISNGVPNFRPPKSRNAATTLLLLGLISAVMFAGVIYLANATRVHIVLDPATEFLLDGKPLPEGYIQNPAISQIAQVTDRRASRALGTV